MEGVVEEEENVWKDEEELERGSARKLGREDGDSGSEKEEKRRRREGEKEEEKERGGRGEGGVHRVHFLFVPFLKPRLPSSIISSPPIVHLQTQTQADKHTNTHTEPAHMCPGTIAVLPVKTGRL